MVNHTFGPHFTGHDHLAGGDQRFAGNAAVGVLRQIGVQNSVRNLVRDLIGVPHGDRFGREKAVGHDGLLGTGRKAIGVC